MATGDSADLLARVKKTLPRRWFAWVAPYRDAVIGGVADGAAWCYSLITYARTQSRIATSTGIFLDLAAWDFLGARLLRRYGETDTSFRPRILKEILRPRQTRAAVSLLLSDLTTQQPVIYELWNPGDCGGYDTSLLGGYDVGTWAYGDLAQNNRMLITAYRSPAQGVPNVGGYDTYNLAYDGGVSEYIDLSFVTGRITDAEIYAQVAATIAAGTTAFVSLQDGPSAPPTVTFTPSGRTPTFDILGF